MSGVRIPSFPLVKEDAQIEKISGTWKKDNEIIKIIAKVRKGKCILNCEREFISRGIILASSETMFEASEMLIVLDFLKRENYIKVD